MPAEHHTTLTPDTPVRYLKGVGPKTAERFEKLGILTLSDLLCHYPRRYLDFSKPYSIAEAPSDTGCVVKAEVFAKPGGRILPGGRRMERITAGDDVSSLEITWFNNPYATQKLELGQEYYFQGIVTGGMLRRQMVNPQVRTAEQIKIEIGSAYVLDPELTMEIKGRNLVDGLPKDILIRSEEVREAMSESLLRIVDAIKDTLECTPPELSSDIIDRGIMLSGGGALLRGLDTLIQNETGIDVHIAEAPLDCVALGAGAVLDNPDLAGKRREEMSYL